MYYHFYNPLIEEKPRFKQDNAHRETIKSTLDKFICHFKNAFNVFLKYKF